MFFLLTANCNIQNFIILASLCSLVAWFEQHLVAYPEDRFSCEEANIFFKQACVAILSAWAEVFQDFS